MQAIDVGVGSVSVPYFPYARDNSFLDTVSLGYYA